MLSQNNRIIAVRPQHRRTLVLCLSFCLCFFTAFSAARVVAQQVQDERQLAPNQTIEQETLADEIHTYSLQLPADYYVHLVAEQKGADVTLTILAPDEREIAVINSPNGTEGPERLSFVSTQAGTYRLRVKTIFSNATKENKSAGKYELKITDWRSATARDVSNVAAQRLIEEAHALHTRRTGDSLARAMEKYRQALALGGPEEQTEVYAGLGFGYQYMGENQQAIDNFTRALDLARQLGNEKAEANILNNMALIYQDLGDYQQALDNLFYSLDVAQKTDNRLDQAVTLHNIGTVYEGLGDAERALEYYGQALPLYRALNRPRDEAVTLNNSGRSYITLGDGQRALDYLNQSLALRRSSGDRAGEAITLGNIGHAYALSGEQQKAIDNYTNSLEINRAVHNRRGEAYALTGLAEADEKMGAPDKAFEIYRQALALNQAMGNVSGEAMTHSLIARTARDRGDLTMARTEIEQAIALAESIRARLSNQNLRASYGAGWQQRFYDLYIDILMRQHERDPAGGHEIEALRASESGRARSLIELLREARVNIRQGVDEPLLERERTLQQALNVKANAQRRLLGGTHTPEQATQIARELTTMVSEYDQTQAQIRRRAPRYAALTQPQPPDITQIRTLLDADTLLLEYELGAERSYLWAVTATSIAGYTLPKEADIEASVRRVYQSFRSRRTPEEAGAAKVAALNGAPARLRRDAKSQANAEEKTASADQTAEAQRLSQTILGPVAALVRRAKRLIIIKDGALHYIPFSALPEPDDMAAAAPHALAGQFRPPLVVNHEIVNLPSAAMLIEIRREAGKKTPPPKTLAILADPVFNQDDRRVAENNGGAAGANSMRKVRLQTNAAATQIASRSASAGHLPRDAQRAFNLAEGTNVISRLPFSRREAEAITSMIPPQETLKALDFAANRATALDPALGQYRIIHFATHGLLDTQHPELSGVVFSLVDAAGNPVDGFLRLNQIYNLNLPADLVVLSACQTALGREIKGEGLVGLTRGFVYAGAGRVVASLWKVDDAATAELMKHFYEEMFVRRARPAAALRAAQIRLSREKRWRDPYFWAAFEMQGEWQ